MKPSQNLLSWQVFVATCRTRSISQAAVLLDIDLPKASRLLSALETELGEPLFDKSHRPIQPTPRAAELQRAVEPLVAGFQAALEPKAEPHERFTIRFAAPIELAQEYFSDKLFQYSELFHDIEFAVLPEVGPDDIRRGDVDVAVLNRRPADPSGLIIRNYNNSTTVPLATPEYLRRHGTPLSPADLKMHEGLLLKAYNDDTVTQQLFFGRERSEPLEWKRTFVTHDQLTLKRLLLEHHGITVDLSILHIGEEIRRGIVVPLLEGWTKTPWCMCLVNRREDELRSAKLRDFVLWMTATAREDSARSANECRQIIEDAYSEISTANSIAAGEDFWICSSMIVYHDLSVHVEGHSAFEEPCGRFGTEPAGDDEEVCGQYALYTVNSAPDDKTSDRTVCPVCDANRINLRHEACPLILRSGDFFMECS